MDALKNLSDSIAALAAEAAGRLFHVPSPLGGRTALGFDGELLLAPALEASAGESLAILAPGGREVQAKVEGFDPGLGLAVLRLAEASPGTAWTAAPGLPALGSLVLAAAFPSPEGPEIRLDAVRYSGGEGDSAYVQTDGAPFPGFSGAALADPEGRLAGFVLADRGGNRGWALPAYRAAALVGEIAAGRVSGRAWLGVSTVPVEAPPELAEAFGDGRRSALLVAGVEAESPAASAGIRLGDILDKAGGRALAEPGDLVGALEAARPGDRMTIAVLRSGERKELLATLASRPDAGEGRGRWPEGHWRGRGHGGHGCGPWPRGWGRCG